MWICRKYAYYMQKMALLKMALFMYKAFDCSCTIPPIEAVFYFKSCTMDQ